MNWKPAIARVFYYAGYIEEWGRGIKLILSKEPSASFKEVGRQFITVFRRKKDNTPHGGAGELPGSYQATTQKSQGGSLQSCSD